MTLIPQAGRPGGSTGKADALKYDAWNRLVQYKDDDSGAVLQTNEYDGLGRRIVRSVYASGSVDYRIHYYYNEQWQLLEERKETGGTEDPDTLNQYLWHPYYIDALAVRYCTTPTPTAVEFGREAGHGADHPHRRFIDNLMN